MTLGWLYLLPSETRKVLVRYSPTWLISCVLPLEERKVSVKFYTEHDDEDSVVEKEGLALKTPVLLLSHRVSFWDDFLDDIAESPFTIHALDEGQDSGVYVTPYRIANVYDSGAICFGDDLYPSNLRQANASFWNSTFNNDAGSFYEDHRKDCKSVDHEHYDHCPDHQYEKCVRNNASFISFDELCECDCCQDVCSCSCTCECCLNQCSCQCECDVGPLFIKWMEDYSDIIKSKRWSNKTKFFCGLKYFGYPQPLQALFISNNQAMLAKVPKQHHRIDGKNKKFVIGAAEALADERWKIKIGDSELVLDKTELALY